MSATRQSWSTLRPLPAQYSQLSIYREFSEQEYEQICLGYIPESMEEKWFIFAEEDTLYFHRSWTGYCIYQLNLIRTGIKYVFSDVFVNRDKNQYSGTNDDYDKKVLIFLIDSLLLKGHPLPPIAALNLPLDIATELHYQHVLGSGPKNKKDMEPLTIRGILGWLWRWLLWLLKR